MSPSNAKKKVFILDDEEDILDILSDLVEDLGCEVRRGKSGLQGFMGMVDQKYDLILTDHNMPKLSGTDLVSQILESEYNRDTPVLMISGYLTEEIRKKFSKYPQVVFVEKPFDSEQLKEKIKGLLEIDP